MMRIQIAIIIFLTMIKLTGAQEASGASVKTTTAKIVAFELKQNYPNPFNSSTTVEFSLPKDARVTITLYDLLGNQVRTLVNENKPAGSFSLVLHADDLPTGIYLYQMQADDFKEMRRLTLLR
jgi:hypothetical protein